VRGDLVACERDAPHQIRLALRHPPDDEERGASLVTREQLEQPFHAADDARFEPIPIGATEPRFERRHLEVLLDVDGKVMSDHTTRGCNACAHRSGQELRPYDSGHTTTALRQRNAARGRRTGAGSDVPP